jgi:hypothetical protein
MNIRKLLLPLLLEIYDGVREILSIVFYYPTFEESYCRDLLIRPNKLQEWLDTHPEP